MFPKVKIEGGLHIDGTKIDTIRAFKVDSGVDRFSEVTVSFLCEIDGLDNVESDLYQFKETRLKDYKPRRKYNSR